MAKKAAKTSTKKSASKSAKKAPSAKTAKSAKPTAAKAAGAKAPGAKAPKKKTSDRRELLEAERERLQAELDRVMARVRARLEESDLEAGDDEDLADAADAIYDRELGIAVADDLRERLRDVDETLRRLDDSEVAKCEVCSKRISKERLKWVPSATRCATCQGMVEGMRRPPKTKELLGEE